MATIIYYQIRRRSDGLCSKGGSVPQFNKLGKLWTKGHLRQHLKYVLDSVNLYNYRHPYDNCEIVEFELTENRSVPMDQLDSL